MGPAFRAHDPRWSFSPLSGSGAALYGGRFNRRGRPALYLSLQIITAIKEISHGFAHKIDPCVLCEYEVDCAPIADLRTDEARARMQVQLVELNGGWFEQSASGEEPASWVLSEVLIARGYAGAIVPSFAPGARGADHNLVLWSWGPELPAKVRVHDPHKRLPKDQTSWQSRRDEPSASWSG